MDLSMGCVSDYYWNEVRRLLQALPREIYDVVMLYTFYHSSLTTTTTRTPSSLHAGGGGGGGMSARGYANSGRAPSSSHTPRPSSTSVPSLASSLASTVLIYDQSPHQSSSPPMYSMTMIGVTPLNAASPTITTLPQSWTFTDDDIKPSSTGTIMMRRHHSHSHNNHSDDKHSAGDHHVIDPITGECRSCLMAERDAELARYAEQRHIKLLSDYTRLSTWQCMPTIPFRTITPQTGLTCMVHVPRTSEIYAFITGHDNGNGTCGGNVYILSLMNGTWRRHASSMPHASTWGVLVDTHHIMVGGAPPGRDELSVDLLHIGTGSWLHATPLLSSSHWLGMACTYRRMNSVYVIGSNHNDDISVEQYNIGTRRWLRRRDMPHARRSGTCVTIDGLGIFITGLTSYRYTCMVDIYRPEHDVWITCDSSITSLPKYVPGYVTRISLAYVNGLLYVFMTGGLSNYRDDDDEMEKDHGEDTDRVWDMNGTRVRIWWVDPSLIILPSVSPTSIIPSSTLLLLPPTTTVALSPTVTATPTPATSTLMGGASTAASSPRPAPPSEPLTWQRLKYGISQYDYRYMYLQNGFVTLAI
jgi:hypothetical protein